MFTAGEWKVKIHEITDMLEHKAVEKCDVATASEKIHKYK